MKSGAKFHFIEALTPELIKDLQLSHLPHPKPYCFLTPYETIPV